MNKITSILKRFWKPLVAVGGMTVMIVYAGGMLSEKTPPGALEIQPGQPVPAGATIVDVAESSIASKVEVVGTTASDRRIQISARISAYVEEVLVSAGDRVAAGQVLARLDDRELREQLTGGEAQLSQAEAEFKRTRQLFERNATTEQAMTAAESQFNTARANVERLKVMLTYATVTSPIEGIVTERKIEAGDLANPGQLLLTIFDPANMRLEVPVPVRLINKFALGQRYELSLDYPARSYEAEVTEIVGEIDPMTRTRRIKLRIQDPGGEVLPGTFGHILVEENPRPSIYIPAAAVLRIGQLDMVNLARDGRMTRRMIKTGRKEGDQVEVISGLNAGDRIVMPFRVEG